MADINPDTSSTPSAIYLKDYRAPAFTVKSVELVFELDDDNTLVHSTLHMERNAAHGDNSAPLVLDGQELDLVSIILDGTRLEGSDYQLEEESLTIHQVFGQLIICQKNSFRLGSGRGFFDHIPVFRLSYK